MSSAPDLDPAMLERLEGHPDIDLDDLWHKVCEEVMDSKYKGRTHGHRKTYDAGCKGPICSKGSRVYARRRSTSTPTERYVLLDYVVDAYHLKATRRLEILAAQMLEKLRTA